MVRLVKFACISFRSHARNGWGNAPTAINEARTGAAESRRIKSKISKPAIEYMHGFKFINIVMNKRGSRAVLIANINLVFTIGIFGYNVEMNIRKFFRQQSGNYFSRFFNGFNFHRNSPHIPPFFKGFWEIRIF